VFLDLLESVFNFWPETATWYNELPDMISAKFESPQYEGYVENCVELLELLVGPDGEHMNRFRSLDIHSPWLVSLLERFCEVFCYDTPHLVELSIEGLSYDVNLKQTDFFRDLSALRHLTIEKGRLGFDLNFSHCNLRSLDVEISGSIEIDLMLVFSIKSLVSLTLRQRHRGYEPENEVVDGLRGARENGEFTLPNLEYLHVDGEIPPSYGILFVLPKLQIFKCTKMWLGMDATLLTARPSIVDFDSWYLHSDSEKSEVMDSIRDLIEKYTCAGILIVNWKLEEAALGAIRSARSKGVILENLKVLRLVDDSGFDKKDIQV
jgi:hypothetical protein